MPADRANDKRYQAYRDFTPGIENISEDDAYRNYATYYSEGASGDTGAKNREFEQFYKASGGGGRAALPEEAAPAAAPAPPAAPPAPAAGGGDGGDVGGMALGGLSQARAPMNVQGFKELPAPGSANPQLGSRLYPMAMRQLAMQAPRVY